MEIFTETTLMKLTLQELADACCSMAKGRGYYTITNDGLTSVDKTEFNKFMQENKQKQVSVELLNKYMSMTTTELKQISQLQLARTKLSERSTESSADTSTEKAEITRLETEIAKHKVSTDEQKRKLITVTDELTTAVAQLGIKDKIDNVRLGNNTPKNIDRLAKVHTTKLEMLDKYNGTKNESFDNWFFMVDKFQLNVISPFL